MIFFSYSLMLGNGVHDFLSIAYLHATVLRIQIKLYLYDTYWHTIQNNSRTKTVA